MADEGKTADELHEEIYGKTVDDPAEYLELEDDDAPPKDDETPPEDDYKHKYDVLQGKYTTELQRSNEFIAKTIQEKEQLTMELAKLKGGPANPYRDDVTTTPEEDLEYFQKEYPNIFKGTQVYLERELAKIKGTLDQATNIASKVNHEKYLDTLAEKVENWEVINKDPKFVEWLKQPAKYIGVPKHQLLLDSFNRKDAATTAQFFHDYLEETGGTSSSQPAGNRGAKAEFSPNTSGNPAPSQAGKGVITRESISQFYRDRASGKFVGSEEEAAKIESRFLRAVREGKVR